MNQKYLHQDDLQEISTTSRLASPLQRLSDLAQGESECSLCSGPVYIYLRQEGLKTVAFIAEKSVNQAAKKL